MSYLVNDPADFVAESLIGFVAAHGNLIRGVEGGIVRASGTPRNEVAIVIGGGSGHYPAFSGLVGPGLAHGAAMGNVFASPSTQQIYSVAKAAENGAGVLFVYGNYAGDVMNFTAAQQRLRSEGIACDTVTVSDDIASAPAEQWQARRGVAGDLAVFKAASFAAAAGKTLPEVKEITDLANSHTFTLGIAFSGCTLPGAKEPLFVVPDGMMAIGMGIHGEPGLKSQPAGTAKDIAHLLVSRLLVERVPGVDDVAVILSGLGSVKYEELYVLYGHIHALLTDAGLRVVEPDVGELVTSFEMAGVSLTLHYLAGDLSSAWKTPAYTTAYRKGAVAAREGTAVSHTATPAQEPATVADASPASQASASLIARMGQEAARIITTHADELGRLDAIAGDGDHGIGMTRGVLAASRRGSELVAAGAGAYTVLRGMSDAWSNDAGGTSGAIWGVIIDSLAQAATDSSAYDLASIAAGLTLANDRVQEFGGATPGDKTLVDALAPLAEAFARAVSDGHDLAQASQVATQAAMDGARQTENMVARRGRSKTHAEKSLGTPDPGALSLALIAQGLAEIGGVKE